MGGKAGCFPLYALVLNTLDHRSCLPSLVIQRGKSQRDIENRGESISSPRNLKSKRKTFEEDETHVHSYRVLGQPGPSLRTLAGTTYQRSYTIVKETYAIIKLQRSAEGSG